MRSYLCGMAVLAASCVASCSDDAGRGGTPDESAQTETDAVTTTNCPGANPDDDIPDTKAIQACLDDPALKVVALARKHSLTSPGLIIDNPYGRADAAIHLPAGKILTSTGSQACWTSDGVDAHYHDLNCAVLIAKTDLAVRLIASEGDKNAIARVIVDGNGPARRKTLPSLCTAGGRPGNVYMDGGNTWTVRDSVSRNSMCGTGLLARGSDYVIARNLLKDNGDYPAAGAAKQPWSDGITVIRCTRGAITDNVIVDATDVGIAHGGSGSAAPADGCTVSGNTIVQRAKHAFSGIGVANFEGSYAGQGLHFGSTFTGNVIIGNGQMDFGIHMGKHPWDETMCVAGGTVAGNHIDGAFVNLNIDGWRQGTVANNALSNPAGEGILLRRFSDSCPAATFPPPERNFTMGDAQLVDRSQQAPKPTSVVFHDGTCLFNPTESACAYP